MKDFEQDMEYFANFAKSNEDEKSSKTASGHELPLAGEKERYFQALKNYLLYAYRIGDVVNNSTIIQSFAKKHNLSPTEIFEGFDLSVDIDENLLELLRNKYNPEEIQAEKALKILSDAVKEENYTLCKKIIRFYNFDFSDKEVIEKMEKIKDQSYQKEAFKNYIKSVDPKQFADLETSQKKYIFRLALKFENQDSIKTLADWQQIYLEENIFGREKDFLYEMFSNGTVTVSSVSNSDKAALDAHFLSFNLLRSDFLINVMNCQKLDHTRSGRFLRDTYEKLVEKSRSQNIPFTITSTNIRYLSEDLDSVKSLYNKGLLNLDELNPPEDGNIKSFLEGETLSKRIQTAASQGNVIFLERMQGAHTEFQSALKEIKDFDKILKKGVLELLKSGNNEEIKGKISEIKLKKIGLETTEKLDSLRKAPSNIFEAIVEKLCKFFLSENYKYENKSQKLIKNFSPNSTPIAKKHSSNIESPKR